MTPRNLTLASTRVQAYQYKILELPWNDEYLKHTSNQDTLWPQEPEAYYEVKEKIRARFWELAQAHLTERQYEVISLVAQGLTQVEIAKQLGCNQSSVQHNMHGNQYYIKQKLWAGGGSFKKLRRLIAEDSTMQALLTELQDIQENNHHD